MGRRESLIDMEKTGKIKWRGRAVYVTLEGKEGAKDPATVMFHEDVAYRGGVYEAERIIPWGEIVDAMAEVVWDIWGAVAPRLEASDRDDVLDADMTKQPQPLGAFPAYAGKRTRYAADATSATALVGLIASILTPEIVDKLEPWHLFCVIVGIGFMFRYLRSVTTGPPK